MYIFVRMHVCASVQTTGLKEDVRVRLSSA